MYQCPNCNRKTFPLTAKLWSCNALPARCRACSGLCFAPNSSGGVLLVLNIVLLTLAGVLASALHSVVPFALGGCVAAGLWLLRLHMQPLVAVSSEQAAAARQREGFWFVVFALLSALQ